MKFLKYFFDNKIKNKKGDYYGFDQVYTKKTRH